MTYDIKELEEQAVYEINNKNLIFIQEVISFLPCASSTFYDMELEKSEIIKSALNQNKINTKKFLREKWEVGGHPTTDIALYRLLSTPEEHKLLNQTYTDHTTDGQAIKPVINFVKE